MIDGSPSGFNFRSVGFNNEICLDDLRKIYRLMTKMREHLETDEDREGFLTLVSFFKNIQIITYKDELHLKSKYKSFLEALEQEVSRGR